jgi:hypothetical protein
MGRVIGTDAAMISAVPSTLFQTSSGIVAPIHPHKQNRKLVQGVYLQVGSPLSRIEWMVVSLYIVVMPALEAGQHLLMAVSEKRRQCLHESKTEGSSNKNLS